MCACISLETIDQQGFLQCGNNFFYPYHGIFLRFVDKNRDSTKTSFFIVFCELSLKFLYFPIYINMLTFPIKHSTLIINIFYFFLSKRP